LKLLVEMFKYKRKKLDKSFSSIVSNLQWWEQKEPNPNPKAQLQHDEIVHPKDKRVMHVCISFHLNEIYYTCTVNGDIWENQ
jgi:hypothetical protein